MNKEELTRCFDGITPNAKQKENMWNVIRERKKGETKAMNRVQKRFPLATAAIVICILATTTVLAVNLALHERLADYFHAGTAQGDLLEKSVDTPELSVSKNGVTITVKQTIADSFGIYVLYEMTVPDHIELSDDIGWYMAFLDVKLEQTEYASAIGRNEILEQSEHHRIGLFSYFAASAPIVKGPIQLSFHNLGYTTAEMGFVTLIEGDWELSWELSNHDSGKVFTPDHDINMNGENNIIKKITISPISMNITATESGVFRTPIYIVFRDGTQMAIDETSGRSNPGGTLIDESNLLYEYQLYHRFYDMIDPNEVESVIIHDNILTLR